MNFVPTWTNATVVVNSGTVSVDQFLVAWYVTTIYLLGWPGWVRRNQRDGPGLLQLRGAFFEPPGKEGHTEEKMKLEHWFTIVEVEEISNRTVSGKVLRCVLTYAG